MLSLNILSEELKKEIKTNNICQSIINIVYLVVIMLAVYAVVFLIAKHFLILHYAETIGLSVPVKEAMKDYGQKIEILNKQINQTGQIQAGYVAWPGFFTRFSDMISEDILIAKISLDKKENKIQITGQAKTREALLEFKESLEEADFINNIDFPARSLLLQKDISFNITGDLISYDF